MAQEMLLSLKLEGRLLLAFRLQEALAESIKLGAITQRLMLIYGHIMLAKVQEERQETQVQWHCFSHKNKPLS